MKASGIILSIVLFLTACGSKDNAITDGKPQSYYDSIGRAANREDSINTVNLKRKDSIYNAQYAAESHKDSIVNAKVYKIMAKYDCTREQAEGIKSHKVQIGMTKQMAIAAWGQPETVNTTQGENYTLEQWVYNLKSYLYFNQDGLLKTIQN